MKYLLHWFLSFMLMKAVDDNGGGEGDRGDDFTPTDNDADTPPVKEIPPVKETPPPKDEKVDTPPKDEKDDKDDKKKDTRIPFARHKEILEKERAAREDAERKVAQYEGGNRVAVVNERITKLEEQVEALDKEYTKLVTDGDHEKAAEKRREMRKIESGIVELKSDMKAQVATSQAVEQVRYDTTVERLEAAYPVLNPDHDDHDADQAQDVLDLAVTYKRRGMTPSEAIQKAARKLLGAETKKQEDALTVKARVDKEEAEAAARAAAAKDGKVVQDAKEKERREAQVKKNVEVSGKQPADTSKLGADSDRAGGGLNAKDVLKMSQDDFNKLDEDTLARMRGDLV